MVVLSKDDTIDLFQFIEEDGLTRKEFASKMGLDLEDVHKIENRKYEFSDEELIKLDEIFESEIFSSYIV